MEEIRQSPFRLRFGKVLHPKDSDKLSKTLLKLLYAVILEKINNFVSCDLYLS